MMYNGGQWTRARFNSFVKSALRSARWPPKYAALKLSSRGKQINSKTGRLAEHYECVECGGLFPAKDVAIDHRIPVVLVTGFDSWDNVIARLFCEVDGLQVLCKPCHKKKTQEENALRKMHKTNNNKGVE